MFSSDTNKLRKLAVRYAELARAVGEANAAAASHPEVKKLLAQLPFAVARPNAMEADGRQEMRKVCVAYSTLLDAAASSPFAEIAKSAALIAALEGR